jgi:ABC-type multidrug transport system fused ATPase/permease subunit
MLKKANIKKGFQIIFRYLVKYKKDLVILSVLSIASALANGFVPYIAGRLFDAILKPSQIFIGTKIEMSLWLFFIILWFLIKIMADIVDWRNKIQRENIGNITYSDYMVKGHSHILELPLSGFLLP